jgi:hypothetical protein
MSIEKINNNLPTTTKIDLLNNMILELYGLVEQGKFDINEINAIYDSLGSGYTRKYLRNQLLGHTLTTYSGWSHIHAESGYSIWKFSPTNYTYNALNQLYVDDKMLENRLLADSEAVITFDHVYLYTGSTYIDNTTEAGTESGTSFSLMSTTSQYLYAGVTSSTFAGITLEFATRGSNYNLYLEYYNGSVWTELDTSGTTYGDDTSNFESDGRIYWEIPSNWATVAVNGQVDYWIRISTITAPVTTATAYMVTPSNSVISLLRLSSEEILNEDWAWCTYGSAVYVTIRNAGASAYEGDYFISSSSTAINKQNYFISNHEFKADYQDSTF